MGAAVKLPIPPSTNQLWRIVQGAVRGRNGGGRKLYSRIARTRKFEVWLAEAALLCRVGLPTAKRYPVEIEVTIVGGKDFDARRRDLDNCLKAVQDAVKHSGRIEDDTCRHIAAVRMTFEPGQGAAAECWVAINTLESREGAGDGESQTETDAD